MSRLIWCFCRNATGQGSGRRSHALEKCGHSYFSALNQEYSRYALHILSIRSHRQSSPNISSRNLFWAGCISFTNGPLCHTDGVFATYSTNDDCQPSEHGPKVSWSTRKAIQSTGTNISGPTALNVTRDRADQRVPRPSCGISV